MATVPDSRDSVTNKTNMSFIKLIACGFMWQADTMQVNTKIIVANSECHEIKEQRMEESNSPPGFCLVPVSKRCAGAITEVKKTGEM